MSNTKDKWTVFEASDRLFNLHTSLEHEVADHHGLTQAELKKMQRASDLLFEAYQSAMARLESILEKEEKK